MTYPIRRIQSWFIPPAAAAAPPPPAAVEAAAAAELARAATNAASIYERNKNKSNCLKWYYLKDMHTDMLTLS